MNPQAYFFQPLPKFVVLKNHLVFPYLGSCIRERAYFRENTAFLTLLNPTFQICSFIPILFVSEPKMFMSDRVYCANIYSTVETKVATTLYSIVAFDILITIGDRILFQYNKKQMKCTKKWVF